MKDWIRTFLVCVALIGGTAILAYLSLNQFNRTLDDLIASSLAIAAPIPIAEKSKTDPIPTSTAEFISTTTTSIVTATSTVSTTSTDLTLSFTFPKQGSDMYFGCTYQLSFQSSTTVRSLSTDLIDEGTGEAIEATSSGLTRERKVEPNPQSIAWKVGVPWPGEYSIRASGINGDTSDIFSSDVFTIRMMPKGIRADEKAKICKESNGSL
jgi:hypothetical protein